MEYGVQLPTQTGVHADDNLITDTWEHLRSALVASAESLFIFIWQKRGSTSQKSNDVHVPQQGGGAQRSISRTPSSKRV